MMQLSEELTSTENKVAFARQAYNDAVMSYNNQREMFPAASSPACSISRRRSCSRSRSPRRARRRRSRFTDQRRAAAWTSSSARTPRAHDALAAVRLSRVAWSLVVAAVDASSWSLLARVGCRQASPRAAPAGARRRIVVLAVICGASLFKTLSLRAGGGVVARSLGGARVERDTRDPALRRLHNVVEEMAIASGVPMPEVYVLENEDGINAFAAGNSPADAAIAVTRGALDAAQPRRAAGRDRARVQPRPQRRHAAQPAADGLAVRAAGHRDRRRASCCRARRAAGGRDRRDGAGALMLAALAVHGRSATSACSSAG